MLVLRNNVNELNVSFDSLREELLRNPHIKSVSSVASAAVAERRLACDARPRTRMRTWVGKTRSSIRSVQTSSTRSGLKVLAGRALDRDRDVWQTRVARTGRETPIAIDRALAIGAGMDGSERSGEQGRATR